MDDANNERMTVGTLFVVLPKILCFIQWMIIFIYIESREKFSTCIGHLKYRTQCTNGDNETMKCCKISFIIKYWNFH